MALKALAGALTGGVGGAAGAISGTLVAPQVGQMADELGLPEPVKHALAQGAAGTVGAAVGGGSGAAAAVNKVGNNYLTSQQLARDKEMVACKSLSCTVGVKMKYGGLDAFQDAGLLIGVGGGIGYQAAEALGAAKIDALVPGARKVGRAPSPGQTFVDDLYKVNKPGVDYVVVEYKFGTSTLKKTVTSPLTSPPYPVAFKLELGGFPAVDLTSF